MNYDYLLNRLRNVTDLDGEDADWAADIIEQQQRLLTRYEAALREYSDIFCELGESHECCGRLTEADCSGCLARKTLGDTQ